MRFRLALGLALALALPARVHGQESSLDPLQAGLFGFRPSQAVLGDFLEGLDQRGSPERVRLAGGLPLLVCAFDARYPSSRALLAGLEDLRLAYRGRLALCAITDAGPGQVAARLSGLGLGYPVLSAPGASQALGLQGLDACLFVSPAGRAVAQRSSAVDWASPESRRFVDQVLAALPGPGPSPAAFLSDLELAVLAELNLARTQPKRYAEYLLDYEFHIRGGALSYPDRPEVPLSEGLAAVEEAIQYLNARAPLPPLEASAGLCAVARAYSPGSGYLARMESRGAWQGVAGENLYQGWFLGRVLVMSLLVDDGLPGRPHRAAILNPDFRQVGLWLKALPEGGYLCVQDFAWGYRDAAGP